MSDLAEICGRYEDQDDTHSLRPARTNLTNAKQKTRLAPLSLSPLSSSQSGPADPPSPATCPPRARAGLFGLLSGFRSVEAY